MALTDPMDWAVAASLRPGCPGVVLRPLRAGWPWDAESHDAADGPRDGRSIPVDPEPDRPVPRRGSIRSLPPSRLRVRGSDRRRPGDPGARRHGPRREDLGDSVRGRVSRLPGLRPAVDPAPAETSELNRHARGGVRPGRRGPECFEVHDLNGSARGMLYEALHMSLADHRDDLPLRLRQLTDRTAPGRISFVDQDPLRGRQLPREFLEEGRLVLVEALQFGLDLLLAGEDAAVGGGEVAHSLRQGHVSPHTACDLPGLLCILANN